MDIPTIQLANIACFQQLDFIIRTLSVKNHETRLIGGSVRNLLIDKAVSDIDIATSLKPEIVTKLLEAQNVKVIPTGIEFGTVTAIYQKQVFEITTLRKDIDCTGRHATVSFTDNWQEDALRRDFTINAMSCDLNGKIYDYFNGWQDLQAGIIRFVGIAEKRVEEDYLRILRFFRFYAYYGKQPLHEESFFACKNLAHGINQLSGERIHIEMQKILIAPYYYHTLQLMQECGVLEYLISGCHINPHILEKLEQIEQIATIEPNYILRLSAILLANKVNDSSKLARRWRLSNKDKMLLHRLLNNTADIHPNMTEKEQKKLIYLFGKDYYINCVILNYSLEQSSPHQLDPYLKYIEYTRHWQQPSFPLNGNDILKLGIKGKAVGEILKKAEEYWLNNDLSNDKDLLLAYIESILK